MDEIYAIIPVTKFKNAKTRLSPFLTEDEREKLLSSAETSRYWNTPKA